jgi:hypothetical protein
VQALCMPDLDLHPQNQEGSKRTEGSGHQSGSVNQSSPLE